MTQKERLEDILKHSENHNHHTFDGLVACCAIDSAVDFQLLDAHPVLDYNEGQKSDVFFDGPYYCGVWHHGEAETSIIT